MITILKKGKLPEEVTFPIKCYNCKTEFTYQRNDVKSDVTAERYVECPLCQKFLAHVPDRER